MAEISLFLVSESQRSMKISLGDTKLYFTKACGNKIYCLLPNIPPHSLSFFVTEKIIYSPAAALWDVSLWSFMKSFERMDVGWRGENIILIFDEKRYKHNYKIEDIKIR